MELSGRGVFLTGGAQGIGRAMATVLLGKGARVFFCDVNSDLGRNVEADLQKEYGADNVVFMPCDVTDADQLKAAFDGAVAKFGAVEICCNNAGIMDERIWEKMLAINTTAQIRGSQLALEHMRRDKGGRGGVVINTVSVAGLSPGHWLPVYTASKHAMIGYTTSIASSPEMPSLGVRWGCLCPMPVNTGMMVFQGGEVTNAQEFRSLMDNFMIETEDVVRAFLKQLEDVHNNGSILVVTKGLGAIYRRRKLVSDDGESNPFLIDKPLTSHPPVPGSPQ